MVRVRFRSQTCGQCDCRVFAATGLQADEQGKSKIAKQAQAWTFETSDRQSTQTLQAVRTAAKFLIQYASYFPKDFIPSNTTQQAVLAISLYEVFKGFSEPNTDTSINKTVQACISEALTHTGLKKQHFHNTLNFVAITILDASHV